MLAFGNQFLPVVDAGAVDVCHHDLALGGIAGGIDIQFVAKFGNGRIVVVSIVHHLHKLRIGYAHVSHVQQVAVAFARLVEIHHRFFFVDAYRIETLGVHGVLVEHLVGRLRGAYLVVIHLVPLVDVGKLPALCGGIVGTVEETVATP